MKSEESKGKSPMTSNENQEDKPRLIATQSRLLVYGSKEQRDALAKQCENEKSKQTAYES